MKQPPTVTRLLSKVQEIFSILESLRTSLDYKNKAAFTVTFYHKDKELVATKWSDQYSYTPREWTERYEYEITSRGISFHAYTKKGLTESEWNGVSWYSGGAESSLRLVDIPNTPPPNYKGTMYLFHQEKIREALSALPAWAIAVYQN